MIIVMNKGCKLFDDAPKKVFAHYKELEKVGLAAPQVTYIMHTLAEKGLHVRTDVTTVGSPQDAFAHQQPSQASWPGSLWSRNCRKCTYRSSTKQIQRALSQDQKRQNGSYLAPLKREKKEKRCYYFIAKIELMTLFLL